MGKKGAQVRNKLTASPTNASSDGEAASPEMLKLKDEGNKLFGRKEYQKALESYEKALKQATPEAKEEIALLHSNKAACYMMNQRFKEAVNECTSALDSCTPTVPAYHKALVRRAKAYEQMGHFKQALSDIQKANKADTANPETQEAEKRLRDIVTGKKPSGAMAVNGTAARKIGGKQRQQLFVFTAKISHKDETRVIHLANQITYAELLDTVKQKFPNAWPFQLKYLDREADLITITDKQDLQQAMGEVMEAAERSASLPGHGTRGLPLQTLLTATPLKFQLVNCAEEEVPKPPPEEQYMLAQVQEMRRQLQASQQREAQKKQAEAAAGAQQHEAFEIDQWILDFANLFREQLNIEPDKHLDLTNMGWDKLQAALDSAVQSDQAPAIFDAAADKFQEVSAHGMLQWGNVFFCVAKRTVDKAALAGQEITEEVAAAAEKDLRQAEAKYEESRRIKPNYYDAFISTGNVDFERAKLRLGFAVPPPTPAGNEVAEVGKKKSDEEVKAEQDAVSKEQTAALKKALSQITAEKLSQAQPQFDATWKKYQDAIDVLPEEDKGKKLKPIQEGQAPEEEHNPWAHCMVMWGNLLYEASQMYAAGGNKEWKGTLDAAVEKFRAAGCPEPDIQAALRNHTEADQLDLPPVKEPEAAKPAEEEEKKAEETNGKSDVKPEAPKEAPKGIPALAPRKKKAPAAEAAKQAEA